MAKNKRVMFYMDEEWLHGLAALAGTCGCTTEELVRRLLPTNAVIGLFFQCRDYQPDIGWDEVAEVGRSAIRDRLRDEYMHGLSAHLSRLGLTLEDASGDDVEAARRRALDELRADRERPCDIQLSRAEQDSVYLGYVYDAWKRAKAGETGYAIAQVDVDCGTGESTEKAWAILKNEAVV